MRAFLTRLIARLAHGAVSVDGVPWVDRADAGRKDTTEQAGQESGAPDDADRAPEVDPREFPKNGANFR